MTGVQTCALPISLLVRLGTRAMLREIDLLWERGLLEYALIAAKRP